MKSINSVLVIQMMLLQKIITEKFFPKKIRITMLKTDLSVLVQVAELNNVNNVVRFLSTLQ